MRVLFTKNIGVKDASRFKLPFADCLAGNEADVGQLAADELFAKGLAIEVTSAAPAETVKATEAKPAVTWTKPDKYKPAKHVDSSK